MGISDRKEREKEELKAAILKAAKRLFLEKGVEKTSIRNIADAIEYSPGIIYHYFKDKKEIFHALHQEGFQALGKQMSVVQVIQNPLDRLKAMGKIYVTFATENPDMYDLMFIKETPIDHIYGKDEEEWKEGHGVFDGLRMTVRNCMEAGHFDGHNEEALSYMIWSTVHGLVSLSIRKRCEVVITERHDEIVEAGLASFYKIIDRL